MKSSASAKRSKNNATVKREPDLRKTVLRKRKSKESVVIRIAPSKNKQSRSQPPSKPRNRRRTRRRERSTASTTNLSVMRLSATSRTTITTMWMVDMRRRSSTPASDTTTLAMKTRITMATLMMPSSRPMVSAAGRLITECPSPIWT